MQRQQHHRADGAGDDVGVGLADAPLGLPLLDVRADGRAFGLAFAAGALAGIFDLRPYYPEILATFSLLGPAMVGFAVGFFVLEDREQGTLVALRLTPLTGRGYVAYRLVTTLVLGVLAGLVIVPLADLVVVPPVVLLGVAVVASLWGAITALLLASLADNAVEGGDARPALVVGAGYGAVALAVLVRRFLRRAD